MILIGMLRVGWHCAKNSIALPLHPFMSNCRYVQFVGRCLKLDAAYPSFENAYVIHLDGFNFDDNWTFLLHSAFEGVAHDAAFAAFC